MSNVSDIYLLSGEEEVGPFSPDALREQLDNGSLSADQLAWTEGLEDWSPLAELLEDETLMTGPGFIISQKCLHLEGETLGLGNLAKVTVEVEHTRHGGAIVGTIIFGLLLLIALFMPHRPETTTQWVIWGLSVLFFLVFLSRNAITAFRPSGTFLAVHLLDGNNRILPMNQKEAHQACDLINQLRAAPGAEQGMA